MGYREGDEDGGEVSEGTEEMHEGAESAGYKLFLHAYIYVLIAVGLFTIINKLRYSRVVQNHKILVGCSVFINSNR